MTSGCLWDCDYESLSNNHTTEHVKPVIITFQSIVVVWKTISFPNMQEQNLTSFISDILRNPLSWLWVRVVCQEMNIHIHVISHIIPRWDAIGQLKIETDHYGDSADLHFRMFQCLTIVGNFVNLHQFFNNPSPHTPWPQ